MAPAQQVTIRCISSQETLPLRHAILRPHQSLNASKYEADDAPSTVHFGAFVSTDLCGVVSLYLRASPTPMSGVGYQIRGMATADQVRKQGIGRLLLQAGEQWAQQRAADYLWANARMSALGFYEKTGYSIDQNTYMIEGIGPHRLIHKWFQIPAAAP